MIAIRRSEERGHADRGWLDTYHTFSFAQYRDPDFMGFGHLRVLNQDRVQPGTGFPRHGHANMEIITCVISGVLEHRDSMGNGSQIRPGDVQLMSAGTGVTHSESNAGTGVLELLQMWVLPARHDTDPRYEQAHFPAAERRDRMRLVVAPNGDDGSLTIGQDTRLYVGLLAPQGLLVHAMDPRRRGWLHVSRGRLEVNGLILGPGDGAAIQTERELRLKGLEQAELVLFDLA